MAAGPTEAVLVGVDSGGTRSGVEVRVETAAGACSATYDVGDSLSGALDPALIPDIMGRILAQLPARLDELDAGDFPVTVWVSAAAYTPWTRDGFTSAMHRLGPGLGARVVAMGAANDAVSLLLGTGAQGVVIAGTGSNVLVRDDTGAIHQAGGHEWVACDYGSGFWIGLHGIRRAFRDFEAGSDSVLLQHLRQTYRVRADDERGLIAKMRDLAVAGPHMKRDIARFTADVCRAADRGDADARNLVTSAAEELADVTAVALRRRLPLGGREGSIDLVQCGSLLTDDVYRAAFEAKVGSALGDEVGIVWHRVRTAEGVCVALARGLGEGHLESMRLPDEFRPTVVHF